VSSTEVRNRARVLGECIDGRHFLVHAIAALEADSNRRVSEVLREETPARQIGALAGPALPFDLVERQVASMVVASQFEAVVAEGRRLLGVPPVLRVYGGADLVGVELAAALAGAHTVALGMADALEVGAGPRAVMMTRAVAEASRLGVAIGAEARTFSGLAGLGNLLVRSSLGPSNRSRDYQAGLALGREGAVPQHIRAEGVRAAAAAVDLAQRVAVRMPLLRAVGAVAAGAVSPADAGKRVAETVAAEE